MQMLSPHLILKSAYKRYTLRANRGPVGIALLGVGGWGLTNAENIMQSRRFNITGVHDIQTDCATRFANKFSVKFHNRLEDLLDDQNTHSVCITTPNHLHIEMLKACADAQKHVFIEKPLCSDSESCTKAGLYCEEKKILLQVGFQMQYEPFFIEIQNILNSGHLGKPLFAQGVSTLARNHRDDWRRNSKSCPRGSMEQLGTHMVSIFLELFGKPFNVRGWGKNIPFQSEGPEWGGISLSFENDVHATIYTSFSSTSHFKLDLFFEKAHLFTDGQRIFIRSKCLGSRSWKPKGRPGGITQFIEFATCIEQDKRPYTDAGKASEVMKVVQAIKPGVSF